MRPVVERLFYFLFFVITCGDLLGRILNSEMLDYIFKPLLMPLIFGYFIFNLKNSSTPLKSLLATAFFFSWLGDILLMFQLKYEIFFICGLGAFLLTQVFYILSFIKSNTSSYLKQYPFWILPFSAYGIIFYIVLFPNLDTILKVAVALYAISLTLMVLSALNNYKIKKTDFSTKMIFTGAFLFLISDSMIAVNKFHIAIPLSGFWIMITYISAQFLIMKGYVIKIKDRVTHIDDNP